MFLKYVPSRCFSLRAVRKIYFALLVALLVGMLFPLAYGTREARAATGEIILCSTSQSGEQGNGNSSDQSSTPDGRYVAFRSFASNLVTGDSNGKADIFRKDLLTGEIVRCSTDSTGTEADNESGAPSISSDGRFVAFQSMATNLVASDGNGVWDVFLKDIETGGIIRCSTDSAGAEASGASSNPSLSLDGNYVAFVSNASNLVASDDNGESDIFRKNIATGETVLCSSNSGGAEGNDESLYPSISSDGRYVAFHSPATDLVEGDTNGSADVFRKDVSTGGIILCSCTSTGNEGNGSSSTPWLSSDGRYVAFTSGATNLVTGDTNGRGDVFRKDVATGAIVRCSTNSAGAEAHGYSASISPDGRYVAFKSSASLTPSASSSGYGMIYLKDVETGKTKLCSSSSSNQSAMWHCYNPTVSSDGCYVFFYTHSYNLVDGEDSATIYDVYRKRPMAEPSHIDSIEPYHGAVGSEVSITGKGFGSAQGSSYVSFDSVVVQTYPLWSDTKIECIVPPGINGSVDVRVTTDEGTSNAETFMVRPKIESINPDISLIGFEVDIIGSGFGHERGNGCVIFGDIEASEYTYWSDTFITVEVPYGVWGEVAVRVRNDLGFSSNEVQFTVIDYAVALAEGYTGKDFQEYLCIGNSNEYDARVEIWYLFPDSTYLDDFVTVPANTRLTIDVNNYINPYFEEGSEVSAIVFSDLEVVVERPIYFNYQGRWTGGHNVIATPYISKYWLFAEGYTGNGFDEYICVFNPNLDPANLIFHFQTQEAGGIDRPGSVPAASRRTFKVNELLGANYQCSLLLEADQMVVVERPIYFDYTGLGNHHWEGGHCVQGQPYIAQEYYFAEGTTRSGFEEWLTIQNPFDEAITVIGTYQLGMGQGTPVMKSYVIPPESRYTVNVRDEVGWDKDVSVKLSSESYFVAERPMYFRYSGHGASWEGGHCIIGTPTLWGKWFFAEGCTRDGFQEWLCLQNPGDEDATVDITFLGNAGPVSTKQVTVPANTRETLRVNDEAGGLELSCLVQVVSGPPIMVERPMYFNFWGMDGGHDVVGYNAISFGGSASTRAAGLEQNVLLRNHSFEPGMNLKEQ